MLSRGDRDVEGRSEHVGNGQDDDEAEVDVERDVSKKCLAPERKAKWRKFWLSEEAMMRKLE
jgi:hypothetical protein